MDGHRYRDVKETDKIEDIKQQVENVKVAMAKNIQDQLQSVATTEQLADTSCE